MTEWLLAQLFDRVRTAMGVRNCADGCHLLQVLVACRLCHICYDLAQRVDVGFRFCRLLHHCLLSHSLQRRSSVHGSVFELRQGLAPDRSGGGTSSVSDTFEDSEALVDMVDGTDCQRIVAMASLTGIVRFVICLVDVSILVAVAFSLADALEVAAGMEEEAMATHHGEEDAIGRTVLMEGYRCQGIDAEWHRLVSEVPEQEEITIITVSVALVLLSQCHSIDAIHGRVSHDAEA